MDGPSLPARIARVAFAIIGSGIVAGIAFLILIQEAERRGHTDLDFNHTLGNIVEGAQTQDATTSSALGVIGDTAAPTGLVATLVLSGVLMAVHGLVVVPLVRRAGWFVQGLVLAVVTFLAVGLIYPPLASEHLEQPLGPFGSGYGTSTVVSIAVACLGFGVVGGRCYALIHSAAWWTPRGDELEDVLEEVNMGRPASLELPEQRGEDRGVPT